eukprot:50549-Hanusia_phi.AAC.1
MEASEEQAGDGGRIGRRKSALDTGLQEVAEHLEKAGLVPEAYAQKWFVGLCVHTMPFEALLDLFEVPAPLIPLLYSPLLPLHSTPPLPSTPLLSTSLLSSPSAFPRLLSRSGTPHPPYSR